MILDKTRSYGTITGDPQARYEQDGVLFGPTGVPLTLQAQPAKSGQSPKDLIIETDDVENAKVFLKNILSKAPLSKASVYKIAGESNQRWATVKSAALLLNLIIFQYSSTEMWKLPTYAEEEI